MTTEPPSLDGALRRLHSALDQLEAIVADRLPEPAGAEGQVLAAALRAETERADRLEDANREAAGRIDHALDTIRSVLDGERQG